MSADTPGSDPANLTKKDLEILGKLAGDRLKYEDVIKRLARVEAELEKTLPLLEQAITELQKYTPILVGMKASQEDLRELKQASVKHLFKWFPLGLLLTFAGIVFWQAVQLFPKVMLVPLK